MIEQIFNTEATKTALDFITSELAISVISGTIGAAGHHFWNRYKNKKIFNQAVEGNNVSPEIKITLLQWDEFDNPEGTNSYDLDSTTKNIDLRTILPESLREELPKYIVAAAKKTQECSPLIFDHIEEATAEFSSLFKTQEERETYAQKAQCILQSQIKYMLPQQWCGDGFLQRAYEGGAANKENFYAVLTNEYNDDSEELRLLIIPHHYLENTLPEPDQIRVAGTGQAIHHNFPDIDGSHAHTQRLQLLKTIVERLQRDYGLREQTLVKMPAPAHRLHQNIQAEIAAPTAPN